jgi:hypothetical protein
MHIAAMPLPRRHLAAVLCVLLLNLQLFAGNVLGCVHSADGAATMDCPHMAATAGLDDHGPTAAEPDADAPCQKCNLGVVAAGWHLVGVELPTLSLPRPDLPDGKVSVRPMSPSPDGLLRPPRSISA